MPLSLLSRPALRCVSPHPIHTCTPTPPCLLRLNPPPPTAPPLCRPQVLSAAIGWFAGGRDAGGLTLAYVDRDRAFCEQVCAYVCGARARLCARPGALLLQG